MYDTNPNILLPEQIEPSINNSCVQSCIQLHYHLLGLMISLRRRALFGTWFGSGWILFFKNIFLLVIYYLSEMFSIPADLFWLNDFTLGLFFGFLPYTQLQAKRCFSTATSDLMFYKPVLAGHSHENDTMKTK